MRKLKKKILELTDLLKDLETITPDLDISTLTMEDGVENM